MTKTIQTPAYIEFINEWKKDFTERIKNETKSRKQDFSYYDALKKSKSLRNPFDECMIQYGSFINSNPLQFNDYYKYLNSYSKGKELNLKFFSHDVTKLKEYYKKFDEEPINIFNPHAYKSYVLFMMLKLKGFYTPKEHDLIFNIKEENGRQYNPLTNLPSVLRGELPFNVKEYDIKRAFPTFIDIELNIDRKEDIYSLIDKRKFNSLLNIHSETKNAKIETVRSQLASVYGKRVNEVITDKRFYSKGQMFRDLVKHEDEAIKRFVRDNQLENYVRLHDGVFVLSEVKCDALKFGKVEFSIKESIRPQIINNTVSFYTTDEAGKVETSPKGYADFFEQENFIRVTEEGRDSITIFKDTNNVVKPFNHKTDIVPFLKENINDFDTEAIENKIAHDCFNDVQKGYLLLNPIELKYHRDSINTFGIPFKNGFVEFTKDCDNLEVMEYKKVKGFFTPHPTQEREFTFTPKAEQSVFERFLKLASTGKEDNLTDEENKTFEKFCSMFGYLIHQYKDRSFNPSIILSDAGANDKTRNGRRGKSLIVDAVKEVRKTMQKGGDEFDPNYSFKFADLTKDYDVYFIDDVPAGFDYNSLYTQISTGINCQRKGKPAEEIPFSESPKFVITTNWSYRVDEDSQSTEARFYEFKLTNYFNINNTPKDVFKHRLFDEWDFNEWNRFYNFAFNCVALYMNNGLQRIEYNKTEDNFKALFNSDVVLDEMERILEILKGRSEFSVSDFLRIYTDKENTLRFDNHFNHKNTKNLIDLYIKHYNLPYKYGKMKRKWELEEVFSF
jgi:hypothetical protein